jgi:chromosome segregation ATPase
MDAISFVVGLRAAFLRSTNLKQLIYNADGLSESTRRTAFVEVCHMEMLFHEINTITYFVLIYIYVLVGV